MRGDHHHEAHVGDLGSDPNHPEFGKLHGAVHHGVDISKINLSSLPENERQHLLLHQKHFGHEGMHASMLLILVVAICVAQIILIAWKKRHQKSFQSVSMFGMWLVPFFISIYNHWWRFIGIWSVISIITGSLISKPLMNKQISGSIPRLIYRWFYYIYSFSSVVAVTGYIVVMGTFLGRS